MTLQLKSFSRVGTEVNGGYRVLGKDSVHPHCFPGDNAEIVPERRTAGEAEHFLEGGCAEGVGMIECET